MDLQDLRHQIDGIDDQLVQLFTQRMAVSADIAACKKKQNLPIFVPAREREKLMDVAEKAGDEMANYTQVLYAMLFELSRSYQSKLNRSPSALNGEWAKYLEVTPGADKTRIRMTLHVRPDALHKAFARLFLLGVRLNKLESNALPDQMLALICYFDLDASVDSEECVQLMCQLEDLCAQFQYPSNSGEVMG
jgi:chorismate mutase